MGTRSGTATTTTKTGARNDEPGVVGVVRHSRSGGRGSVGLPAPLRVDGARALKEGLRAVSTSKTGMSRCRESRGEQNRRIERYVGAQSAEDDFGE